MFGNRFGGNSSNAGLMCPIHQKTKDQIVHICTESKCESQPLLCGKCLREDNHKDHHTVSFYEFAEMIDGLRYDQTLQKKASQNQAKIKASKVEYLEYISKLKETFIKDLDDVEKAIIKYTDDVIESQRKIIEGFHQIAVRPFQLKESSTAVTLADQVKEQRVIYSTRKQKQAEITKNLEKIFETISQENSLAATTFNEALESAGKIVANIHEVFNKGMILACKDYCFKCNRKIDHVSWHCPKKGICVRSVPIYWGFFAEENQETKRTYCLLCHGFIPPGGKHCQVCNKCEVGLDFGQKQA